MMNDSNTSIFKSKDALNDREEDLDSWTQTCAVLIRLTKPILDRRRKTEFDSEADWRDKVQICFFGPTLDQDRLDFAKKVKRLAGPLQ